ncbi:MAG: hypothetical protein KIT08_02735 [Anaerolineales bacterium]|nr:MAG: hypothetical protein KIT08_02735 [Anaerolineales bacterium]
MAGTLDGAGTVHMNALGYSGGSGGWLASGQGEHRDGYQGQSYPGYGTSSASANGGGGGGTNANRGAGGGYATSGANGVGTTGGQTYGDQQLSRLWMGSGGGGSDHPCNICYGPNGGAGGGAVYIYAQTIDYDGALSANGGNGACYTPTNNYSSGGGSGGTVRLQGANITLNGNLTATKGSGCITGDGGVGRIAIFYSGTLGTSSVSPAAYVGSQGTPEPTATPGPIGRWGNGADGNLIVDATFNIHTQNSGERVCGQGSDAVVYSVTALTETTATLSQAPGAGCLAVGDEVVLINMQGNNTNYTNVGIPQSLLGTFYFFLYP